MPLTTPRGRGILRPIKNRWRITKNIREYRQRRKSDIKIFVKGMYSNMINRTNKEPERFRGIILKSKFYEIALTSYRLNQLHYNWCNNNCKRGLTSSVDRINNKRGYFHDNIQFLTLRDNCAKGLGTETLLIDYNWCNINDL